MRARVGFIGLGIMGRPMAKNILGGGFALTVWNRTPARMDELVRAGAAPAASLRSLAEKSDVIITMVSDSPDVKEVLTGAGGVAEGIHPGAVVIDMSTISPQVTRDLAAYFSARGVAFLDAPVSGGETGAVEGTLSIMVGGEAETLARVLPVLQAMGRRVTHIGPVGMGQVCKLANQIAVALNNLSMSEALLFAAAAGADPTKVLEALQCGAASSWAFQNLATKVLRRDFSPGFMVSLQQKDLRLVLDLAGSLKLPMPGTALAHQLYHSVERHREDREGNHALIKALERLAGIEGQTGTVIRNGRRRPPKGRDRSKVV